MPALARLVERKSRKPPSHYEYYLPLSDVLMALAKRTTDSWCPPEHRVILRGARW